VLLIHLLQKHVVVTHILADTTLEVACNKQHVVWARVAGSGNDKEPEWHDMPVEAMNLEGRVQDGFGFLSVVVVFLSCFPFCLLFRVHSWR
jgi:hypothetical protein